MHCLLLTLSWIPLFVDQIYICSIIIVLTITTVAITMLPKLKAILTLWIHQKSLIGQWMRRKYLFLRPCLFRKNDRLRTIHVLSETNYWMNTCYRSITSDIRSIIIMILVELVESKTLLRSLITLKQRRMCIKCYASKSILLFSYFGLFCTCLQSIQWDFFWFSHQIYGNLGRSIPTQNKQIEFHTFPFNSIHDSVLYSPCVTVNFMRQEKKPQLNIQCIQNTCLTQTMFTLYTYSAIDQQIEFEWCDSVMDRKWLLWEVCC